MSSQPAEVPPQTGSMRSRFNFIVVGYVLVVLLVGTNLPTPLYPLYEHAFGFGSLIVTLVFAVYAMVLIPSLLLFGPLSDAAGRRTVLVPAVIGAAVASVILLFAQGPVMLFVARALQGLALGAVQGTATAALVETEPHANKVWAATIGSMLTAGATALGPLIAGGLGEYLPGPLVTPYIAHLVLVAVALMLALRLPRSGTGGSMRPRRPQVPPRAGLPFVAAGLAGFLAWAVTALFLALVPSFVTAIRGGVPSVGLAGGCVGLMLAVSAATQVASRSAPAAGSQLAGFAALVPGLGLIAAASALNSLVWLLAAAAVTGVGQGLAFRGSLAVASRVAPEQHRANVVSLYYVIVYIGVAFPVIGVGLASQAVGLSTAVLIFAAVIAALAVAGAVYTLAVRQHPALTEASGGASERGASRGR